MGLGTTGPSLCCRRQREQQGPAARRLPRVPAEGGICSLCLFCSFPRAIPCIAIFFEDVMRAGHLWDRRYVGWWDLKDHGTLGWWGWKGHQRPSQSALMVLRVGLTAAPVPQAAPVTWAPCKKGTGPRASEGVPSLAPLRGFPWCPDLCPSPALALRSVTVGSEVTCYPVPGHDPKLTVAVVLHCLSRMHRTTKKGSEATRVGVQGQHGASRAQILMHEPQIGHFPPKPAVSPRPPHSPSLPAPKSHRPRFQLFPSLLPPLCNKSPKRGTRRGSNDRWSCCCHLS